MNDEARRIVLEGYDRVADAYSRRFESSTVRQRWFDRLLAGLPPRGGRVLDLGCGSGIPVARDLVAARHHVVGVDGSSQQIARARRNVPEARFIEADLCTITFGAGEFDAVCAFYSMNHIPALQQGEILRRASYWLRPGGTLIASFGTGTPGEWIGEWLGTTMFFDHPGEEEILRSMADADLRITHRSIDKQDNEDVDFMWVRATKGAPAL